MTMLYIDPVVYNNDEYFTLSTSLSFSEPGRMSGGNTEIVIGGARGGVTNAIKFFENTGSGYSYVDWRFDPYVEWYVSFRVLIPSLPGTTRNIFGLTGNTGSFLNDIDLRVGNDGQLRLFRGNISLATSSYVIPTNTYIHIECNVIAHATDGYFEVKVDEHTKLTYSGNTVHWGSSAYRIARFGSSQAGGIIADTVNNMLVHDFAIRNSEENETWWGDTPIIAVWETGMGDRAEFFDMDGGHTDNYNIVANNPFQDDEFIYSAVNGNRDLYHFSDLSNLEILGIQDFVVASSNNAAGIYPLWRLDTIFYQEDVRVVTPTLKYYWTRNQNSLATLQPWTLAEFNGLQSGQRSSIGPSVHGIVYLNISGGTVFDPDIDIPLQNIPMKIYVDNGDLVFDPNTDTLIGEMRSDAGGYYSFIQLVTGQNYWVFMASLGLTGDPNPIGPIAMGLDCVVLPDMGLF